MNSVIDQLFKIEQAAKDMQSSIDKKKDNLRKKYQEKEKAFDREIDQETQQQLKEIQENLNQKNAENRKEQNRLYEAEIEHLEKDYRQKKEDIVKEIVGHILKERGD
ncbi:hypothetical protein AKA01nite_12940 [Alkalibacterium kapii]|uniref:V-type ATP synthase subunit G n=1 Tax=Alkalibacterium kapii TaxID=426704 RepID=A0A511AVI4_9LACT|nr:hypothetical protein AKA01nite_12940 [Alkalibacterium kapii]